MYCHKCGAQIKEGSIFCHKCGAKVANGDIQPQDLKTTTGRTKQEEESVGKPVYESYAASVQVAMPTEGNVDYGTDFKAFVDNHVQQTTKFQSAEELLDSRVSQKFIWICFGIPAIVGFLAGGPLLALLFGLFFGYPAALLTDFMKGSRVKGSIKKISGKIDSDGLIQFLNGHLSYLSPYFHEWNYINYRGAGVQGAVTAHTLNSITASAAKVGTGFGRKQRCFVVIWIEPDGEISGSNGMKYYFSTAMKFPWPSKYICMVKTTPILQAVMEYYLKYSGIEGGNGNVLS
ncbi:zinc ribbon domain-containing protein [Acetatifactor muris]|uniref:Zinc-ribbon domain-containing protein n=1 Tax=Acetatifactor muris TaxID=879566 RepID=A0A2K4ZLA8_9FIRM|nr:zinc ribbon domain-containing protein [Acetatifactor muris]MCR2049326.1 zinc ribbon domain-containing protein [Acetatifactor muris]SOY31274.1 hypothetical protein AMURIS_04010 [Acetatifactor muris]